MSPDDFAPEYDFNAMKRQSGTFSNREERRQYRMLQQVQSSQAIEEEK